MATVRPMGMCIYTYRCGLRRCSFDGDGQCESLYVVGRVARFPHFSFHYAATNFTLIIVLPVVGIADMMKIHSMLHVGKLIRKELRKQRRSQTWLADEICCTRPNIYKIMEREYIDTDMLWRISRALRHNFFSDISQSYDSEYRESK